MRNTATGLKWLWLSLIVYLIDLGSKWIVISHFQLYESIKILPIFNFTYVRNYGAAFSFLADHSGWQKYFFIVLALAISALLTFWLYRSSVQQKLTNSGYAFIIGGALANMTDRIYHGYVVDFLDFHWGIHHYPVFNLADSAIFIGVALLLLDSFLQSKKAKIKKHQQSEEK